MNAIEIRNLNKKFPTFALENLNLTLPSGTIMGLVGENGAGKSTTLKLILNILKSDSGTITILGQDNQSSSVLMKEDVGVVLDEVGLPSSLTIRQIEQIMKHTFKNWNSTTFFQYIRDFSIPEKTVFSKLSKGMKMKVGLAIALSHDAKLLILDEATSGLDPVVRDEILDIFCEFTRSENHSILISSHIVSDLEKICDYIAFLHQGKLLLCEEKDKLKEEYVIIHCTPDEFQTIPPYAVIGKKSCPYGIEAIIQKECIPAGITGYPVDIEQLFIFMVKEEKRK